MPAQKPDPRRSPTPYALNLRLTKAQYAYLALFADDAGGSMGAVVRQVLDEKIDSTPLYNEGIPEDHPGAIASTSMRWLLERADLENLDADELRRVLRDDEGE